MRLILRFWREYASRHLISYSLGILFLLLTNGLSVLIPRLIQWSIDALEQHHSALWLGMALLGAGLGTMIVRTLSRTFIFNPGRTIEYELKQDLFAHLLKLPKSFYEKSMSAGEIINRGTNDSAAVRGLVGYGALQLFNVAITLAFTLSQMLLIDLTLTLWCAIPLSFAAIILRWAVLQMFTLHHMIMSQTGELGDRILESYAGVSLVRLFGAMPGVLQRFSAENQSLLSLSERVQTIGVWLLPIVSVMGNVCVVLALYIGGSQIKSGTLSLGELSAMIVYINLLVSCLTSLGWLTGAIQRGYISLGRLYEVLDHPIERAQPTHSLPSCDVKGRGLTIRGLSFRHPTGDIDRLNVLSLQVNPGEVLGIFGLTGAGKSTLLDVLSRTYEPPPNTVFIDGVDITSVPVEEYWTEVGYVQQTPYLFSQSLRQNIALAGERDHGEGGEGELAQAIQAACLDAEVSAFPKGLETKVGERGITLSGGQKQRTSLARVFYRNQVRLLLLDDVLSAVDHHTENKLIQSIYRREPQCTTVIVSHRMSVLQGADQIIVLQEGEIVERGAPEILKTSGGIYAQAWEKQNNHHDREQQESP